jgi:hypothetical protein
MLKRPRSGRKPSPALLVAIAALCVALVGTAVAGPIAEISLNKAEKKQTRKIARKIAQRIALRIARAEINRRAGGLSVANANTANTANSANTANEAEIGSPAAYAMINEDGVFEDKPRRGISDASISNPEEGAYCVNLAFNPTTGSGNTEAEGSEDGIVSIEVVPPFDVCPDSAEAEVRIYDVSSEGADNEDVFVQFDN